ncbi:MAG: aspartate aminotransferase family protein [Alphaproteobacteria bacterium]|nr:aspartate aminotransferase family protein [Alphaproteobacteria bacterium]
MISSEATLRLTRAHESTAANTFRVVPDPPIFVRGDGPWLFTVDGTRYLDLVCGSATTSLGHAHPAHMAALQEALATGILHTGTRLPSPFRATLYERLQAILPPGLTRVQLVNSGSEAVEAAIKGAQFATGRSRLVAFDGGYHGRTLGALSLTSGQHIRAPFHLLEASVDILPYPGPGMSADQALVAARTLMAERAASGDLPALVLVEAVQALSGLVSPGAAFLRGLSDLCREHDIPLALDEIWNGIGRTGCWFGFDHAGIVPDIVILGKALSGGLPLSAVAAGERFLGQWPAGMHTSTFQGNPLACAMAVATLDTITNDSLLGHVENVIAPMMAAALQPLVGRNGVTGVRCAGAQAAIEFRDPAGQPDPTRAVAVQCALLDHHILAYGGGRAGECLMLVPPINLGAEVLSEALSALKSLV